jgi:hypothetical protein
VTKEQNQNIMETNITKEHVLNAWKNAIAHKKDAKQSFENWLRTKGIEGKVVTL